MNYPQDHTGYLYTTAIPVLLGEPKTAGRAAEEIYLRHQVTAHWFGRGRNLRLLFYAKRYRLPAPMNEISDNLLLQILLDFASEQHGILALYPCDRAAEDFVARNSEALESRYVILSLPDKGDLLAPLVRKSC